MNASSTNKLQGGVQSLEIGLSIFDVLIDHNEPMMLKDIAHVMDMHPAKAHRYLVSLIRKGYACQFDDGRYGLGPRIEALGQGQLTQPHLFDRLLMAATAIKDTIHCGVQIAKWFSEGPIIIGSIEPDSPISIITRIGSRMPLTTSATGQLFASYQPEAVVKPLVMNEWQNSGKATDTEALQQKWQNLQQRQSVIRTQGYATVTGDMLAGINAITLPVLLPPVTTPPNPDSLTVVHHDTTTALSHALEYAITIIGTEQQLPMGQQHEVIAQIVSILQRHQIIASTQVV